MTVPPGPQPPQDPFPPPMPGWQHVPPPLPKPKSRLTLLAVILTGFVVLVGVGLAVALSNSGEVDTADSSNSATEAPEISLPDYAKPDPDPLPAPNPAPPSSTPPPAATGPIQFGQPWVWENGMTATVVSATQFEISEYAAGNQPGQIGILVVVTYTNNGSTNVQLAGSQVEMRAGASGLTASRVFDTSVGEEASGTLAPGQAATGQYAFGVNPGDEAQLSISVTPSFEYEDGLFTGAAG